MYTIIDILDANISRSFSERVRRKKRIVIALVFLSFFPLSYPPVRCMQTGFDIRYYILDANNDV
jgi:hypothetical protein